MNIFGICGSPRKNGNSSVLLQELLKGAECNGADVSYVNVVDLNINHCIHCDECIKTGTCIYKDDMLNIFEKISQCDILIISSPLHFANISSQLKVLIDRMQLAWVYKYVLNKPLIEHKQRKCVFVTTAARNGKEIFNGALMTIKDFLHCADITLDSVMCFNELNDINDINLHSNYLKECFNKGVELTRIQ